MQSNTHARGAPGLPLTIGLPGQHVADHLRRWNTGEAFTWGGVNYTGLGGGANQGTNPHPVPANFGSLMNVTVQFCTCWSARDPDGGGADRSLSDKIVDALNRRANSGNSASGFIGTADAGATANLDAPNQVALDAAGACLDADRSWANHLPANRPGADPNQQTAAQAIVDACAHAADTTVTIKYSAPVDGGAAAGSGAAFQLGCVCPTTPPGCGLASFFIGGPAVIPTVTQWGLIVMGLLLLTAGTIVIRRYKAHQPRPTGAGRCGAPTASRRCWCRPCSPGCSRHRRHPRPARAAGQLGDVCVSRRVPMNDSRQFRATIAPEDCGQLGSRNSGNSAISTGDRELPLLAVGSSATE